MKNEASARTLAETMVGIGAANGTPVVALLTDMTQPLGREIGNANEIRESIDVLHGNGPADLVEITYRLGIEMLVLGDVASDALEARRRLEDAVQSGRAIELLAKVIAAQDGNPHVLEDQSLLPSADSTHEVAAAVDGFVQRCDALELGLASVRLGGGRMKKEDDVDAAVGITLARKLGDAVKHGDTLATVSYNDEAQLAAALPLIERAFEVGADPTDTPPLVIGEVRD